MWSLWLNASNKQFKDACVVELVQHIHNEAGVVAGACSDVEPQKK